jgi:hypothetical protein
LVWSPWHSYEWKKNPCHDCHGFKSTNINNYSILIIFLCSPMPFSVCWMVIASPYVFGCKNMIMCPRPQHKLDSKSVVCIFIKYCITKKKRLWNEENTFYFMNSFNSSSYTQSIYYFLNY